MFWISNMFWESILPHDHVPLILHQLSQNSTKHFNFSFKVPYCYLLRVNFNMFRGHIKDIHIFYRSTLFMWLPLSYLSQWHNRTFKNYTMVQEYYSVCLNQHCQHNYFSGIIFIVAAENKNRSHCAAFLITCKISAFLHAESTESQGMLLSQKTAMYCMDTIVSMLYQLVSKLTGFSQHSYNVIGNSENLFVIQSFGVSQYSHCLKIVLSISPAVVL